MTGFGMILGLIVLSADEPVASTPPNYWRNPLNCGPSCLYAYLKLYKVPVEFDDIRDRVPLGQTGANFANLRAAASELGVPSVVLRVDNSYLDSMALPAIAQLHVKDGHFKLILQVTSDKVTAAEMTSGVIENIPRDRFLEQWSGFVLVPQADGDHRTYRTALGVFLVLFSVLLAVYQFGKKPR